MSPDGQLFARHVFWPVGHGGFASGQIFGPESANDPFTYVYDCGAKNLSLLRRRIRQFAATAPRIDLLFLSHLDADHVNGVEHLSMTLEVGTVVLPYLDHAASLMTAGAALAGGDPSWTLLELLADPRRWAGRRGIGRIVFVERSDGEGGPSPEAIPTERPEPEDDRSEPWWTSGRMRPLDRHDSATEADVLGRRHFMCSAAGPTTTWAMVPHVPPLDSARQEAFLAEVVRRIPELLGSIRDSAHGPGLPFPALETTLCNPHARRKLKHAYRAIASEHNAVSLALFSGPVPFPRRWILLDDERGTTCDWSGRCGYLLTGDAPVKHIHHEPPFLATYRHWLPLVHHVQVPHHGSRRSVSRRFFEELRGARFMVAARSGSSHHPAPEVVRWAMRAGRFHRLDERDCSQIVEHILWPD